MFLSITGTQFFYYLSQDKISTTRAKRRKSGVKLCQKQQIEKYKGSVHARVPAHVDFGREPLKEAHRHRVFPNAPPIKKNMAIQMKNMPVYKRRIHRSATQEPQYRENFRVTQQEEEVQGLYTGRVPIIIKRNFEWFQGIRVFAEFLENKWKMILLGFVGASKRLRRTSKDLPKW